MVVFLLSCAIHLSFFAALVPFTAIFAVASSFAMLGTNLFNSSQSRRATDRLQSHNLSPELVMAAKHSTEVGHNLATFMEDDVGLLEGDVEHLEPALKKARLVQAKQSNSVLKQDLHDVVSTYALPNS